MSEIISKLNNSLDYVPLISTAKSCYCLYRDRKISKQLFKESSEVQKTHEVARTAVLAEIKQRQALQNQALQNEEDTQLLATLEARDYQLDKLAEEANQPIALALGYEQKLKLEKRAKRLKVALVPVIGNLYLLSHDLYRWMKREQK